MHPELEGRALLISGHHGTHFVSGDRIVLDESGGTPSDPPRARALQAIILPERSVVPHYELHELHATPRLSSDVGDLRKQLLLGLQSNALASAAKASRDVGSAL
jgi:hypothetical protein